MSAIELTDLSRLCIHTMTTKPWDIETAIEKFAVAGAKGITIWRQWLEGRDPTVVGNLARSSGLEVVSTARGGFFPAMDAQGRQAAIDDNRRAIDEAAAVGTDLMVVVCGAVPGLPLQESRKQIQEGINAVLDHARAAGVRLAVEPLHPMYASDRSAINTLRQANDLCDQISDPLVGVAVDVFHLWWDPDLKQEVDRCGAANRIFAFHICDWLTPTEDMLNDRGLMGDGCINIREIRSWVEAGGFDGFVEVEIFSNKWWSTDQDRFLGEITNRYLSCS